MQSRKLLVIACRTSGKNRQAETEIKEILRQAAQEYTFISIAAPPEIAKVIARRKLHDYAAVAIYGGDGTIAAGLKAFSATNLPVLILPGGTANILALYYNMPATSEACLRLWLRNTYIIEHSEIASVNGEPLVLDMHMGFWTETIASTPRSLKRRFGRAAYVWSTCKKIVSAHADTYTFALHGKSPVTTQAYSCIIANQGHHSILGVPLFPSYEAPGMVQIALIKKVQLLPLVAWFIMKLFGKNLQNVIEVHRTRQCTFLQSPHRTLSDDADRHIELPVYIKAEQYHCKLILPPTPPAIGVLAKTALYVRTFLHRVVERLRIYLHISPGRRFSLVAPNLYLGGRYPRRAYRLFRAWGITGVVSMRRTVSRAPADIELLQLPTPDWHPPTLDALQEGVTFMKRHIENGGSVYVHCHLGEGRGPTMAAAYLISQGYTVDEALAVLRKYRPSARPNAVQRKRLAEWQDWYNSHYPKEE